jgi:hypothetical protein
LCNSSKVTLLDSANRYNASLNEVLNGEIVNTARAKHDVGTGLNDLFTTFFANIHLALANLVQIVGVLNEHLYTHLKTELIQVKVNASNLSVSYYLGHTLRRASCLDSVTIDELGLLA